VLHEAQNSPAPLQVNGFFAGTMLRVVSDTNLGQTYRQKITGACRLSAQKADVILTTDEHR